MKIIVNVDLDWGIGRSGQLLVHLSQDLKRFKQLTIGGTVVYGRKTLLSFPGEKPLPGRDNIILTRDQGFKAGSATICHNLAQLAGKLLLLPRSSIFIIGGDSIYRQLLPYCDQAVITRVFHHFASDASFPNLAELPAWRKIATGPVLNETDRNNPDHKIYSFQYCLYQQTKARDLRELLENEGAL